MAGVDQENLQYGIKVAGAAAQKNGDNERIAHMNELFTELSLDGKALKKRGSLPQPQADKLIASALFDIGPAARATFRIENLGGILQTVQGRVGQGADNPDKHAYNPDKQSPTPDLIAIISASDKVRTKMLNGDGKRYDVEDLDSGLGQAIKGGVAASTGSRNGITDLATGLFKMAKSVGKAIGLQPSDKKGPLTLGDIRKAQIALVAHDGVPEADARDALWAFQKMKPFLPKNEQKAFDMAADRVRGNVAKAEGQQVERGAKPDPRKPAPQTAPQPAGEEVDCSALELIRSLADKAQGKPDAKNCKTPEVQSPTPTGPGGFSMGGS